MAHRKITLEKNFTLKNKEFEDLLDKYNKYNELTTNNKRGFCIVAGNGHVWRKRIIREQVWAKSVCMFESDKIRSGLLDYKWEACHTHVESDILEDVLGFCTFRAHVRITTRHYPEKIQEGILNVIDEYFLKLKCKSAQDLVKYLDAACDLKIKSLLDLTSTALVKIIGEMDTADILKMFDVKEKVTVKEIEQQSKMYPWAFK